MGSLEIDENSAGKGPGLKPVPDFGVTEEVVGGVHDNNRLGDNSLLDHAVFSRVTRAACARYMLDDREMVNSLAALGGGELRAIVVGGGWADMSAVNTELGKRWQHGVVGQVVVL